MHAQSLDEFRHDHVFLGERHAENERKTWAVIALCGAMMVLEIGGGALFGSMALIADGLHMSTHAGAMVIAALAYAYARRHARDERFSFGAGKVGDLAAFASAIVLAMIAVLIGYESLGRLLHPTAIAFREALPIAVLGLGVNVASAWLLRDDHDHHHHGGHEHDHDDHAHGHAHHHHDLNLRAAYVHVLADAAVSILAIIGLSAAWILHWRFLDPVMGLVGALVVANWSWSLVRQAGAILLDMRVEAGFAERIARRLENEGDRITDLHVWRLGPGHAAAVVSLVSDHPQPAGAYKRKLGRMSGLSHVTVEVEACPGAHA